MFDEEIFEDEIYDETFIQYKIEDEISNFVEKIKEKYSYNWDKEDIYYSIDHYPSYVSIKSNRVADCLTQNVFKILDKEERGYFDYLEILPNYVQAGRCGNSKTEFDDVRLYISGDCPDEMAEEIEDKICELFYEFVEDLEGLVSDLEKIVFGP